MTLIQLMIVIIIATAITWVAALLGVDILGLFITSVISFIGALYLMDRHFV